MRKQILNSNTGVQDSLSKIEADLTGVCSLEDVKGSILEKTALQLLPEAKSIVVFAMEIFPEIINHARPEKIMGAVSMNELLVGARDFLHGRLAKAVFDVTKVSHRNGLKALPLMPTGCPSDMRFLSAVFSFKHAAQAAGLGKIGINSLLITPEFGPRVRLACCLTEAVLEPSKVTSGNLCTECGICIKSCPSHALSLPKAGETYAINKYACASFLSAGGGCVECMRLCPKGKQEISHST